MPLPPRRNRAGVSVGSDRAATLRSQTTSFRREKSAAWTEYDCNENNNHVGIGGESYFLSADGYLMPAKKDQPPPDLRYFNQPRK